MPIFGPSYWQGCFSICHSGMGWGCFPAILCQVVPEAPPSKNLTLIIIQKIENYWPSRGHFISNQNLVKRKTLHFFLEWQTCHSSAEGSGFYQNYHTIACKLGRYLPIFYFPFYQKTNLYLYKGARLTLLLFIYKILIVKHWWLYKSSPSTVIIYFQGKAWLSNAP